MSHSKQQYSKKVADAILILLDEVILEEIIGSKSINSIDDWYQEITNSLFPNSDRYAKTLVSSIQKNKYYELSVLLYKNRNYISKQKDKIINELVKNLTKEEFNEYCNVIEKDLFGNIKEENIISLLKFISSNILNNFSELTKYKLEDMILDDIKNLKYYVDCDSQGNILEMEQIKGYMLENSKHLIDNFSNKTDLANTIIDNIVNDFNNEMLQDYLYNNYLEFVIKQLENPRYDLIDLICDRLRYKNEPVWFDNLRKIIKKFPKTNKWYISLADELNLPITTNPFSELDENFLE